MDNCFIKLHNNFIQKKVNEDQYLIMNITDGDVYEINETSYEIINLCDGNNSLEDIIYNITNRNMKEPELEEHKATDKDIIEFINELVAMNICSTITMQCN